MIPCLAHLTLAKVEVTTSVAAFLGAHMKGVLKAPVSLELDDRVPVTPPTKVAPHQRASMNMSLINFEWTTRPDSNVASDDGEL